MVFVYDFAGYRVSYSKEVEKDLRKIDAVYATKIRQKFDDMVTNSSHADVKRLQGQETPVFRLRVGTYRALFEVHQKTITIL